MDIKIDESLEKLKQIPDGSVVAIIGDFNINSISCFLACMRKKCIVVPLGQMNEERIKVAECEFILETNSSLSISNTNIKTKNELIQAMKNEKGSGLVLFTSGSTGIEKAALHNLEQFISQLKIPKKKYKSILFMKFDHIGGVNTLLQLLSSGGTGVCVAKRDPESICHLIEKETITLFSSTSSFLAMLLASKEFLKYDLSSLKLVTFGTEPISQFVLDRWPLDFPSVPLYQTYGMTETGILGLKSLSSSSAFLTFKNMENSLRVKNNVLQIKQPESFKGYLNYPFSLEEWYSTGDRVKKQDDAFVILGRESDWIIVGGEKVSPFEVEDVLMSFPGVLSAKVFGKDFLLTNQIVAARIFVKHENRNEEFIIKLKEFCMNKLDRFKVPADIEFYDPIAEVELKKKRTI